MDQIDKKSKTKICKKTLGLFCLKYTTYLGILFFCVVAAFIWRLHTKPLDIDFAKSYIEQSLHGEESGRDVKIEKIVLHWPDLTGPLLLGLQGVQILDANSQLQASVDGAAVSFSRSHLLRGEFSPKLLIVRQPALKLIREEDGSFEVGFGAEFTPSESSQVEGQTDFVETIFEYIAHPGRQDRDESALAALEAFQIKEAKILVEDQILQKSWSLPSSDIEVTGTEDGLVASLHIHISEHQGDGAFLDTQVVFDWDTKDIDSKLQLRNFDLSLVTDKFPELSDWADKSIIFDADLLLQMDKDLNPSRMELDLVGKGGLVQDVYASMATDFETRDGAIFGPLAISIDQISQDKLAALWPAGFEDESATKWLVHRMSEGTFESIAAKMDLVALKEEQGWDFDVGNIEASFSFFDLDVDYNAPLQKVEKSKGTGAFNYNQENLLIQIEEAKIGELSVTSAELEFDEIIAEGKATADIHIVFEGALVDVFNYLSSEPIGFTHEFDLEQTAGRANAAVNLSFPASGDIKKEDMKVNVLGAVNELKLPDVVKDLDLAGGPYSLKIEEGKLDIKGSGTLEGRAIDAEYHTFLSTAGKPFDNKVRAKLSADDQLRTRMGIDLSEFLEGTVFIDVDYTEYQSGKADAYVTADLKPAKFFVEPFDYEKLPAQEGSASLLAKLDNGILKSVVNLKGTAPKFSLEEATINFQQKGEETELLNGKAKRFVINKTDSNLEFEIAPSGQIKMVLAGPTLDIRPFLNDDGGSKVYEDPPMLVSVSADRMITSPKQSILKGKIYADIDTKGRFNQLEMDGIAGQGDIYLRYKPDDTGKRVFRLEADDAGAALKAFDVYDQMVGGQLLIYGEPIKGVYDRNLLGRAEINNFKVVKAPGLARLIGAMSVPGLVSTLGGEGLSFAKLESNFDWLYRPKGSLLVLKDGRTSGNSLGLTFDGTIDQQESTIDVSGTIVPLSGLNKMVSSIPIIGDLLGGGDGLFAATYSMKGDSKEPEVSINPLSVLAPGILRKILFE